MASRIAEAFSSRGQALLVPYVTAGWPGLGDTPKLMAELAAGGAGIIELGVPFSDPSADGPVVQRANERALENGSGLATALDATRSYRDAGGLLPVVLMGYANPFLRMGADELAGRAEECGVDGILAVDWPPSEGDGLGEELKGAGVDRIVLVSPTTTEGRMREVGGFGSGYAYYVSVQGVTGGSVAKAKEGVGKAASRVRKATGLPVAVGFGVRTPEDCAALARSFDAVVVGSRLIKAVAEGGPAAARELLESMRGAMA